MNDTQNGAALRFAYVYTDFFFKLYQVDDDEEEDDNDTYDDRIRKNSTTITMINR